jgi:hypothetical protein
VGRWAASLAIAAALVVSSGSAHAAAAIVQRADDEGTTTAAPAWGSAVTAGHLLVAVVQYNNNSTVTAPSGWLRATFVNQSTNVGIAIYYRENCAARAAGATESFAVPSSTSTVVQLAEFSGIVTSGALDVTGTNSAPASTSVTVSSSSPTTAGPELVVGAFGSDATRAKQDLNNASAPFMNIDAAGDITGNTSDELGTYAPSVSQGTTVSETISSKKPSDMAAVIATFKVAVTTYYWRGGLSACSAGTLYFDDTHCWSTTSGGASASTTPGSADAVIFDGGGTGNCTMSLAASGTIAIGSLTVKSGYTGTITQSTQSLSIAGAFVLSGGTFVTGGSTRAVRTNQSGTYDGDLIVAGGTFTGGGAPVAVRSLTVSSGTFNPGSSVVTTNNGGTVTLSGGSATFGAGAPTFVGAVTISGATVSFAGGGPTFQSTLNVTGGSATFGSGAVAVTDVATLSGGTTTFGSGTTALGSDVNVTGSGASVTFGAGATTVAGTATVSAGAVAFTSGASNPDFTTTGNFTQSGGTITMNAAQLTLGSAVAAGSDGFTMTGGTFNAGTGTLKVTGSSSQSGATTTINGATATFNGASATETFAGVLTVTNGTMNLGTASMTSTRGSPPSNANADKLVAVASSGTLTLGSAGFAFASTSAMTMAGTLNAGSGTVTFSGPLTASGTFNGNSSTTTFSVAVTLSGTFNVNTSTPTFSSTLALSGTFNGSTSTTSVTFTGAVTMTGLSAFHGNTGIGTFSVAPTLTAGTFTVGSSGTTGRYTFTLGATFTSGMTLAFPANGGELSTASGQTFSVAGPVTSAVTGATLPKIDCPACTTNQGFTMQFTSTATLNVNGLQFDHVSTAGVQIANGATYTLLERLKFTNNAAGGTSSGTHLAITKSSSVITIPGCFFDATAQYNVTLSGVSGSTGVRAIFDFQSTTINGARAGDSFDLDADTTHDNVADTATTPRFGSVVEWVGASPVDTAGTAVGFPTAAFDWNTFVSYGIYVSYKNVSGAGTADTLWLRNSDGSAAYSYSVPNTSGDLIGTPLWDTVNETTLGLDVNGDGDQADADLHVVYLATTTGHLIKLIDTGAALSTPTAPSVWVSDFTNANVVTISSGLAQDHSNLYFGGTDSTAATRIFGVQISAGVLEKTLVKNIGSASLLTTTPSFHVYGGKTYLFIGSTALLGQAYVYRVEVAPGGVVESSFTSGLTTSVNGSIRIINNFAYAVTDGGQLNVLDASNFGVGGFTNVTGFPYQSAAASPIKSAPLVDAGSNIAYFGDNAGNLYAVTHTGANLTGYPFAIPGAPALSSSPLYLPKGGVIAVGGADGYLYFIDRHDGTNTPQIFKRYFVTSAGTVSSVSFNFSTSQYMVSTSDGKLVFINGADVPDPTPGTE